MFMVRTVYHCCFFCFIYKYMHLFACLFIYHLKRREREKETKIFHLLIHFLNATTTRASNSIQVTQKGGRDSTTRTITCCLPWWALARSWNWKQSWDMKPVTPMWEVCILTSASNSWPSFGFKYYVTFHK